MRFMMKNVPALLVLALVLCGCIQSPQATTEQNYTAEDILKEAIEKYNSIESYEVTIYHKEGHLQKRFENKTEHAIFKLPDKFRREVESDFESLSVSNGTITWNYDELLNIAIKTDASRMDASKLKKLLARKKIGYGEILYDLLRNYELKLVGEEELAGRSCYLIETTPKEAVKENLEKRGFARWVEKVWIDKEQLYPVKLKGKTIIQFRRGEEEFSWTTEYREIKFNVRVSDEVFSFTPPRDAKS